MAYEGVSPAAPRTNAETPYVVSYSQGMGPVSATLSLAVSTQGGACDFACRMPMDLLGCRSGRSGFGIKAKPPNDCMETFEKIVVLDNEVQAGLVDSVLSARGIPHIMHSYHDSALDGLFQGQNGWGHIEAPQSFKDEILTVVEDLKSEPPSA